jgi:hypothetical protein
LTEYCCVVFDVNKISIEKIEKPKTWERIERGINVKLMASVNYLWRPA